MIGFTKSFARKGVSVESSDPVQKKVSLLDSDEFDYGMGFGTNKKIPEKVPVSSLSFEQMDMMYLVNPWIRACIDKIVNRVIEIDPLVKPVQININGDSKPDDNVKKNIDLLGEILTVPNENYEGFSTIRKKVHRDILKFDAGAIEINKELSIDAGKKVQLFTVPGNTIKLNVNEKGQFSDKKGAYLQVESDTLKVIAKFSSDGLMYFMETPQSDRVYGLSKLESLVQTVTSDLYASNFNQDFFYNNATPRFAVLMEGLGMGQSSNAIQRFRTWWNQELKGQPHKPIIIATDEGKIQFQRVNLSAEEMQFQDYSRWLLVKIMSVYNMQPLVMGVLDVNMGKMNSSEQHRIFKQDAMKPQLSLFAEKFNTQVVWNVLGMKNIYLDFDLDLVDKKEQAEWHEKYLNKGVLTINEIRVQGLGLMPVSWGNVPYLQNNVTPFGVDSNGENPSVPISPEQSLVQAPEETTMVPTSLTSRFAMKNYLMKGNGYPIGWEGMDVSERMDVVEKLIKQKEQYLSKVWMIPKTVGEK